MSKSLNKSNISNYFSSTASSFKKENLSPIDQKRVINDDEDKPKEKKANWGKFAKDAFTSLLSALLFMYMGASIIGFSKYYLFNKMGGTDSKGTPYNPSSSGEKRSRRAGFSNYKDPQWNTSLFKNSPPERKGGMKIPNTLQARLSKYYNDVFGLNTYAFPYKNSIRDEKGEGYSKDIVTWITDAIIFSFSNGRKVLETILSLIGQGVYGSKCKTMENCKVDGFSGNLAEIIAIIGIPLSIMFLTIIPVIPVSLGLFTMGTMGYSFLSDIKKVALDFPIIPDIVGEEWSIFFTFFAGLFLLYSWIWMFVIGNTMAFTTGITFIIQFILLNLFVFIGPLLEKSTRANIKEVFVKRLPLVCAVVAWFLSQSAFDDLGETGGWVVTGSAIGFTILSIYGLLTGNNTTPSIPQQSNGT